MSLVNPKTKLILNEFRGLTLLTPSLLKICFELQIAIKKDIGNLAIVKMEFKFNQELILTHVCFRVPSSMV